MLRSALVRVVALVVCLAFVTALIAAEGTVVSLEKGKLTVKVGDKEKVVELKGVKVTKDGKEVEKKELKDALKKDAKVDLVEDGDKVKEIKVK